MNNETRKRRKVLFPMGGKGGTGKTTVLTALSEWFSENGIPCVRLDLDTENKVKGSFCHFFPEGTRRAVIEERTLDSRRRVSGAILTVLGEVKKSRESDQVIFPRSRCPIAFRKPVFDLATLKISDWQFTEFLIHDAKVRLIHRKGPVTYSHVAPGRQEFFPGFQHRLDAACGSAALQPVIDNLGEGCSLWQSAESILRFGSLCPS